MGGPSVGEFQGRVAHNRMKDWMGERGDVFFWRHGGLHSPGLLLP